MVTSLGQRLRDAAEAHAAKQRCGEFDSLMAACLWLEMRGVDVDSDLEAHLMIAGETEGIGNGGEIYTAVIRNW